MLFNRKISGQADIKGTSPFDAKETFRVKKKIFCYQTEQQEQSYSLHKVLTKAKNVRKHKLVAIGDKKNAAIA